MKLHNPREYNFSYSLEKKRQLVFSCLKKKTVKVHEKLLMVFKRKIKENKKQTVEYDGNNIENYYWDNDLPFNITYKKQKSLN